VAAEVHYHRSCYRLHTKDKDAKASTHSEGDEAEVDSVYEEVENQAHSKDFAYVREQLLVNHGITNMTELTRQAASGNKLSRCDISEKLYQKTYPM